jgi:perosamine synthetase
MKIVDEKNKLAINGGSPLRTKPWINNITTGEEEKQAVLRVMDSGYLSLFEGSHSPDAPFSFKGGHEVQSLEKEWCDFYGSKFAVSVNSATSGLFAAIGALGLGFGDEIIVSPFTMTACAVAPLIYGAIPIFADVELDTGCLDPESIEEKITSRTKAILVIHQFGFPADMDRIMGIAKKYHLAIIEDCAQAHGSKYKGKAVGTIGDIGVFSLNVNKTIQSGEGGVCITDNEELAYRLQLIRNHGEAVVGPANYKNVTNIIGFNYRLTEIQAAIAREQLKKLPILNEKRLMLVNYFIDGVTKYDFLSTFIEKYDNMNTYYVVPIRYHKHRFKNIPRTEFIQAINAEGVLFYQGYTEPLYLQPLYQYKKAFKHGYPWSAPENKATITDYSHGACPNVETLHYNEIITIEHIRPPHNKQDLDDMLCAIEKCAQQM